MNLGSVLWRLFFISSKFIGWHKLTRGWWFSNLQNKILVNWKYRRFEALAATELNKIFSDIWPCRGVKVGKPLHLDAAVWPRKFHWTHRSWQHCCTYPWRSRGSCTSMESPRADTKDEPPRLSDRPSLCLGEEVASRFKVRLGLLGTTVKWKKFPE